MIMAMVILFLLLSLLSILTIMKISSLSLSHAGGQDLFPTHTSMLQAINTVPSTLPSYALLFDCDGVIVETEEMHRLAYNASFKECGAKIDGDDVEWSVDAYDVLQVIVLLQ